ncbi:MAG: 5-formyltetrahydrofolate cyclo-ligase [Sedimenticola sp.]|nr:5-formyltetrahydrofolate cyclo-ligase [Sedimenticola sp.]
MQNLKQLRQQIRKQRKALSRQQQRKNSLAACRHFIRNLNLLRAKKVALYLAADGELDPLPLINKLRRLKKRVYLPVLRPNNVNALWFSEYRLNDSLRPNRFGILEPNIKKRKPIVTWGLDLIIMPLVAFNNAGTRVGMGGGYYDRTLGYQHSRTHWIKPKLIGYAHECQYIEELPSRAWDIPLHAVITEHRFQSFITNQPTTK